MKEDEGFLETKARKARGFRGKGSELAVETVLKGIKATLTTFDYDRIPDTRAAGRILPATVCDFLVFKDTHAYALEVKELKSGFRLQHNKFPQYPRMLRRQAAGCYGLLLIHFTETKRWGFCSLLYLTTTLSGKSWDLRTIPMYQNARLALIEALNVPAFD